MYARISASNTDYFSVVNSILNILWFLYILKKKKKNTKNTTINN